MNAPSPPVYCVLFCFTGYKVFQPQNRTINPDGSVIISCEHNATDASVIDARLSSVEDSSRKKTLLCQIGKPGCENIVIYNASPTKYLFILLNNRPEAFSLGYQCEFTLKINDIHLTKVGGQTQLLPALKEAGSRAQPWTPPQVPPQVDGQRWTLLEFILIGLLALTLLYSCIFTWYHIRQRGEANISDPENSTYVEMRKAPPPRNHVGGNVHYAEVRKHRKSRSP
ncbi:uncharacterized protein LOC141808768 isoform X2 [Halichoeres trimaculatus]|uniref:uncharacterized protein LOC141808768 isoform X2 n=1 Tax=Halichoeres trimaculatus TaxID=147232 RepID=UPI003D9F67CF